MNTNRLNTAAAAAAPHLWWFLGGSLLGALAWGLSRTPILAVVLPLLCFFAQRRMHVFMLALGYHLAVVRFLPEYLQTWFDTLWIAVPAWLALGIASALGWSLIWTASRRGWVVAVVSGAAFVLTLLPPFAAFMPGHPLIAWGYLLEGKGWFGVAIAVVITMLACAEVRRPTPGVPRWFAPYIVTMLVGFLVWASFHQKQTDARMVEDTVAVHTGWGPPPRKDLDVIERIEKVADISRRLSGSENKPRLIVFPETTLGRYDTTFGPVLRNEVVSQATGAGQAILMGAEIDLPDGTSQNGALIVRRDGTSEFLVQRQPALASMWAPWKSRGHFTADWMRSSVVTIESGLSARVMVCYEEYMPLLHLLSEATQPHVLVVAIANAWAAPTLEATQIQANHTLGMAMLFGRRVLRSENYRPEMAKERRAYEAQQQVPVQ